MTLRFGGAVFLLYPVTWLCMLLGGMALWWPPVCIFAGHLLFDNCTPRLHDSFATSGGRWADLLLYAHVPCAIVTLTILLWQSNPTTDVGGIGALLSWSLGDWVMESHRRYSLLQQAGCAAVAGLMMSTNHIVGHELVHRRAQPVAMAIGRWLLAGNGDAQFSVSHVFGHHMNVGTPEDPATARRGENVYRFALRSAVGQFREALEIERRRLDRLGQGFVSHHNALLTGVLMSLFILTLGGAFFGAAGVWMLVGVMVIAKFLFEVVNYIQHYGLVRAPGKRVEPRHSWDCDHRWATLTFYNLARHAHHHAKPVLPYWQLETTEGTREGVAIRYGYIAAMLLAAIPPLWYRHTAPLLARWDAEFASEEELQLLRTGNKKRCHPSTSTGVPH